jgi:O-acetyl-ADP-ribose deacetylase (regulator of RNase III)
MDTKIQTKTGNLLHVKQGHIVHGCNAQGVMGSGVAVAVKETYPAAYEEYRKQHEGTGLVLGVAYPVAVSSDLVIWNAITQATYGYGQRQISYDAIETCFNQINTQLSGYNNALYNELHIPLIGAARGGGNWEIIREIIEQTVTIPVTLWLPDSTVTTL